MGKCAAESLPTTKRPVSTDGSGGLTVQDSAEVLVYAASGLKGRPEAFGNHYRRGVPADTRVDRRREHRVSQVHGRDAVLMSGYI